MKFHIDEFLKTRKIVSTSGLSAIVSATIFQQPPVDDIPMHRLSLTRALAFTRGEKKPNKDGKERRKERQRYTR